MRTLRVLLPLGIKESLILFVLSDVTVPYSSYRIIAIRLDGNMKLHVMYR